jgi:hypothetical protein
MTPDTPKNLSQPVLEWGVYTLANDGVIEWFQAFIRSLRKANPTIPLTVIPYSKSVSQLQRLVKEYDFTIMEESECSHFDDLETLIMGVGKSAAMFRKWACFYGRYTNFIFLDSDVVVTSSLEEILDVFATSPYDFIYFDVDIKVVYTPGAAIQMAARYGSVGFIAGTFVSRKDTIDYHELMQLAQKAAGDREKLVIDQVDQPFLNYAFDVSGRRIASINSLLSKFATFAWARFPFVYDWNNDVAIYDGGKIMPFIHWAGCAYPTMVRPDVFLRHRTRGLSPSERIRYTLTFYFHRYRIFLSKVSAHIGKVLVQFFTNKAWRKFYLCKLIGVKTKYPDTFNF